MFVVIEPSTWQEFLQWVNRGGFSWRDLLGQDKWLEWTPVRTGWTDVGAPTVTGRFRIVGRECGIQIAINPATSIATVAGTSYIDLPVTAANAAASCGMGNMMNVTANTGVGVCVIRPSLNRIYVPAQAASGNNFAIAGWFEI